MRIRFKVTDEPDENGEMFAPGVLRKAFTERFGEGAVTDTEEGFEVEVPDSDLTDVGNFVLGIGTPVDEDYQPKGYSPGMAYTDVAKSAYLAYANCLESIFDTDSIFYRKEWEELPEDFRIAFEAAVRQAEDCFCHSKSAGGEERWKGWRPPVMRDDLSDDFPPRRYSTEFTVRDVPRNIGYTPGGESARITIHNEGESNEID